MQDQKLQKEITQIHVEQHISGFTAGNQALYFFLVKGKKLD